ncbi:MAG: peptidoglycan-associated lipoprotein Pal [Gammaproteobacteria bacterium]|nr:peptidoglycan-associated lipoprotein Pal [Gammaproteobacteria bacterium]MDE0455266.1 peptidoglycan-associated lipoprotein Pal [Gammaproteobacteria bacterium]
MNFPRNTRVCLPILLSVVLAACETSGTAAGPEPGPDQAGTGTATADGGATAAGAGSGAIASGTVINREGPPVAIEPGRSASGDWIGGPQGTLVIYFDYDRSSIREEYSQILQAHGAWLAANQGQTVRLEGHADERGTPEYNLALGSRRANAVNQALTALGAAGAQLNAVSFGEERPAAEGADEIAWSQNRRVELVYETN